MTGHTTRRTIGVAIAVPEPYGSQLREARADCGDAMAATVPTHITLSPPAELDDHEVEALVEDLRRVASSMEPFLIRLRGTGTFRPISPVVFVMLSEGISCTEILAEQVRRSLGDPDLDFPFHPHVTVAHHLDDAALDRAFDRLATFECTFCVTEFALYFHDDEAGWVPQQAFSLLSA